MKDYTWLAVFSVFTLIVGFLFTYGNGTRADTQPQPAQLVVTATSTPPPAPIIIQNPVSQPAPPSITVNVVIATSTLAASAPAQTATSDKDTRASRTYYVTNNTYTSEADSGEEKQEVAAVTLTIEGVYAGTTTPIESGETALELLTRLNAADPTLGLTTQDYGDMGILVTALGGLTNGTDGKYWQYQVNGETPMIGADQYELADGMTVLWEFKGF